MFIDDFLTKLNKMDHSSLKPRVYGRVSHIIGHVIEAYLDSVPLGARVRIFNPDENHEVFGEVVGFKKNKALIIPFSEPVGICAQSLVECLEFFPSIEVGTYLKNTIINGYGKPLHGESPFPWENKTDKFTCSLHKPPLNPLLRQRIVKPFDVGIRTLNGLLTLGEGQRLGIMAGSGVGKSVLLGMMARYTQADINVIGLIGERGREVREFLEENLGPKGLEKSIVVVATGDESPLLRIRAAQVTTAIAEWFRDSGHRVLMMLDSLTRVAMAQREIGLAIGEPPTSKGYTPSVFSLLPKLLERTGNFSNEQGSLTAIYTVLVDGDDFQEPICDAARGILDGHIHLTRELASLNHYPAIDVLSSASRVMSDIITPQHLGMSQKIKEYMGLYKKNEDLISIGAYQKGQNQKLDVAIHMHEHIESYLKQEPHTSIDFNMAIKQLEALVHETI